MVVHKTYVCEVLYDKTKSFEYNGAAHTIVCSRKKGRLSIKFDGVPCQNLKKCSLFGGINLETEIIIEDKKFTVRWFEKNFMFMTTRAKASKPNTL